MLFCCKDAPLLHTPALFLEMAEGLHQKPAGAAGGVKDGLPQAGIGYRHHELHHRPGGVELPGVAGRVPHLPEHGLIEMPQGVDFIAGGEVDAVDLVDHIPQQIAADHAVDDAAEDPGDDVPAVAAVRALEVAQIGEQAGALGPIRAHGFVLVDEGDEFIPGDAVLLGGPIPPAIGRFNGGPETLPGHDCFHLPLLLHVVQELQEHDPGEHGQPVQVAVEALVLAHDVPGRFDDAGQGLGGGNRLMRLWNCGP